MISPVSEAAPARTASSDTAAADAEEGVDERAPYPQHFEAHYPATKAAAEKAVLAANGPDLATVALRPHLIWGPRDNHLVPRILARGRAGQLRRIGSENKRIDSVYVDNAATSALRQSHPESSSGRREGHRRGDERCHIDQRGDKHSAGERGRCRRRR